MENEHNPMARYVDVFAPDPDAFGGTGEPAKINWSAIGSVAPERARLFAQAVIDACNKADELNSKTAA